MKIWNFGVNALQLHLFCPHNTKLEIAAVFTAAISHWIAPSALPVGRPVKRALISNGAVKIYAQNCLQAPAE